MLLVGQASFVTGCPSLSRSIHSTKALASCALSWCARSTLLRCGLGTNTVVGFGNWLVMCDFIEDLNFGFQCESRHPPQPLESASCYFIYSRCLKVTPTVLQSRSFCHAKTLWIWIQHQTMTKHRFLTSWEWERESGTEEWIQGTWLNVTSIKL